MRTIGATPAADFKDAALEEQARVLEVLRNIEPISQREQAQKRRPVAPSIPRYDLEQITAPTLVISAEDDLFGTFKGGRYTAEHIPGARFVGYPTGGHLLVGHGTDVMRELTEFRHHSITPPQDKNESH